MIRGAVYQVTIGDAKGRRGHEQSGKRYAVVVSPSNMPWSVVTIVPTSTSAQPTVFRPLVDFDGRPTRVLIDQIRSIDTQYVGEQVGYLTRDEMAEVEHAMASYLGIIPLAE